MENTGDVMVESIFLRNLKASDEPSLNAQLIEDQGTSSVRSALFRDRSKSRRDNLAAKLLDGTCVLPRELLTKTIGWIQQYGFQRFPASGQQGSHPIHVIENHVSKPDPPKLANHVLQKAYRTEVHQLQPSSQRRDEGWNERRITR